MNIGFSFVDLAVGGAQTFLVQLAQGLAQRGHALTYYLGSDLADPVHTAPSLLSGLNVVATAVAHPRDLLSCDVIQLDGYHSLRRKLPYLPAWRRCVETYHSVYSVRRSGPIYVPHRVAISQAVQMMLKRPSHLIYYGFPMPLLSDGNRPFDVAILGRIHPVKQHGLFLQVCRNLYQQRGQLTALLIGGHPQAGSYQAQIDAEVARLRQLGLDIHMTGDVPATAVFDWLAQTKLLLVTSASEGFGRMAVEALACGVPVIANPVGGLLEIVQHGQNGFLAQANDAESFTEFTGRLLNNEILRYQLGQQGRQDAESRFSLAAMVTAYETYYQQVAQGNG